jgi:hypothetical protein
MENDKAKQMAFETPSNGAFGAPKGESKGARMIGDQIIAMQMHDLRR